jgi:hypothetical protein
LIVKCIRLIRLLILISLIVRLININKVCGFGITCIYELMVNGIKIYYLKWFGFINIENYLRRLDNWIKELLASFGNVLLVKIYALKFVIFTNKMNNYFETLKINYF